MGLWRWGSDRFRTQLGAGLPAPEQHRSRLPDRHLSTAWWLSSRGNPAVWGLVLRERRSVALPRHQGQELRAVVCRQPDSTGRSAGQPMKLLSPERTADRVIASTVQRRWRWAALAGLVVFLGLAGYALAVMGASKASNVQPVSVLVAATDIRAGTTITDGMVRVTGIRADDSSLLTTLVSANDRSSIVGQVAALTVPAGHLIPSNLASPQVHGQLWLASIPVKRNPAGHGERDPFALTH